MKIAVLGLRGFPNVQGGIETHAEKLYPRLARMNFDITILARAGYIPASQTVLDGVRFVALPTPKKQGIEAFVHTFIGVLYCAVKRPDLLHIHAVGPSLMVPLARLFGLRVVVTHHGPDYERQKWGGAAKWLLKTGEAWGARFSNAVIAISRGIQRSLNEKYSCRSYLIPNGVELPALSDRAETLAGFGLLPGKYILNVSRFVPEKRQIELVEAFKRLKLRGELVGWKLALVGAADHETDYSRRLEQLGRNTPDVVLTGFQKGQALRELFQFAGVFCLPSSHEGLPIALLEALSFGLPVVASDIEPNMEIGLPADSYFPLEDIDAMAAALLNMAQQHNTDSDKAERRKMVAAKYDWDLVAADTRKVYLDVLGA
jgi:glycosyltransferase involved in cell wall biosynthesis